MLIISKIFMVKDAICTLANKMGEVSAIIDTIYKQGPKENLMIDLFKTNTELKKLVGKLE